MSVVEPEAVGRAGLRRQVSRGLRWSVVNTVVSRLGSLVAGAVLARLLLPAEYGVYAVALVVLTALLSMNELGVSLAIVRWERDVRRVAPTVATLALLSSAVLYVGCFLAAPVLASVLNAPAATPMIRVLCLCVLVDAAAAVPSQVLSRSFAQGKRFVLDLAALVLGTGLSVVLAVTGLGAWSLVWGFLVSNVVAGSLSVVLTPWRTGFGWDREVARELLHFGLPLASSSLVLFVMMNVDYIVVGKVVGITALGLYLMAFNLCSWPVNIVSTTIRRVSLSGFSRVAVEEGQGPRAFLGALSGVMLLTVPMCVGLAVFAREILGVVYGGPWVPAATALSLLVLLALTRIVVELVYDYLVSADRNRSNLVLQTVWLVTLVPTLVVGAHLGGIAGVALGHALVCLVVLFVAMRLVRATGVATTHVWHASKRPLLAAVPMAAVGVVLREMLSGDLLQLVVGGGLSGAVYLALVWPSVRRLRGMLGAAA